MYRTVAGVDIFCGIVVRLLPRWYRFLYAPWAMPACLHTRYEPAVLISTSGAFAPRQKRIEIQGCAFDIHKVHVLMPHVWHTSASRWLTLRPYTPHAPPQMQQDLMSVSDPDSDVTHGGQRRRRSSFSSAPVENPSQRGSTQGSVAFNDMAGLEAEVLAPVHLRLAKLCARVFLGRGCKRPAPFLPADNQNACQQGTRSRACGDLMPSRSRPQQHCAGIILMYFVFCPALPCPLLSFCPLALPGLRHSL